MYVIQRIECGRIVEEWRTESKSRAKVLWSNLKDNPNLYPQLIVDGVAYTIGQAEKLFGINLESWLGGGL